MVIEWKLDINYRSTYLPAHPTMYVKSTAIGHQINSTMVRLIVVLCSIPVFHEGPLPVRMWMVNYALKNLSSRSSIKFGLLATTMVDTLSRQTEIPALLKFRPDQHTAHL